MKYKTRNKYRDIKQVMLKNLIRCSMKKHQSAYLNQDHEKSLEENMSSGHKKAANN